MTLLPSILAAVEWSSRGKTTIETDAHDGVRESSARHKSLLCKVWIVRQRDEVGLLSMMCIAAILIETTRPG